MISAGFVGGGFMGRVHTRAARASRARLVGIVSSTPERSRVAANDLGVEHAYDSLADLLAAPELDVVHVLSPNEAHLKQAIAAIEAGKHVICEKPLGISAAEARRMVDAASAAGVVAAVPFAYRYHPMVREARARVQTGELGRLFTIDGAYLQDWLLDRDDNNWRVDPAAGGASRAFADIGSHLVDLIEFVTGDRIVRVAATNRTYFESRGETTGVSTEDADAVLIQTAGGAIGSLLVSQVAAGHKNGLTIEIGGSAESIGFEQESPDTLWIGRRESNLSIARDAAYLRPDAARLVMVPAGHAQGYQDAFNGFVADSYAAMKGDEPDGLPRFSDGLRAAQITEAVMLAANSGEWIDVEGHER